MSESSIELQLSEALPDRSEPMQLNFQHQVFQRDMRDVPEGAEVIWLAAGCFWGVERLFWQLDGVVNTAVGYAGGYTQNPTYKDVCTGKTGHTEIVQVAFIPSQLPLKALLKAYWEAHDPTQGMRQGNDRGTQYRSAIYAESAMLAEIEASKQSYQEQLNAKGLGNITTEIKVKQPFYFAEEEHQQYLYKNPEGYCGLKGTGAVCPI
ncbi:peptide-methionine (S)-S-oxide reductase MsrA [Reinekea marina]|uniref:Peptide methionine sulfoxide reductase MsrA n=1 Tax=Reinekea marina TaxID=1310421 RepID=A0ABV7WMG6_9GAMM|nr:peptide-methionine (S)-S-oxide reductase MsrA [Reinekea marina]MDN3648514.1 peptide-methionine (S)-S-oxide reductase MsrA [Reinekea marina]